MADDGDPCTKAFSGTWIIIGFGFGLPEPF